MKRFLGRFLAIGLVSAVASGCLLYTDRHGHTRMVVPVFVDDGPEPVGTAVSVQCHHHDGCGHYWYNGAWYAHHGHRHGPSCGHYYHGGRWVLAGAVRVNHGHTCNHNCNHYHHDGTWYAVRNHRHGPGCGHTLRSGIWIGIKF